MSFEFHRLNIPDIILVQPERFDDDRGYFLETYKYSSFRKGGISERFVQDNYSCSKQGVLRGLHYQRPPQAQGKLVSVRKGEVFDVVVDIRVGSPTYGEWIGHNLSAEDHNMLYIPVGFAHGFQVISPLAEVFYKVTAEYAPEMNSGIVWDDSALKIPWPIPDPILSSQDETWPKLIDADQQFIHGEGQT